jgi:hypothetical protein
VVGVQSETGREVFFRSISLVVVIVFVITAIVALFALMANMVTRQQQAHIDALVRLCEVSPASGACERATSILGKTAK